MEYTLAELAELCGASLEGTESQRELVIRGPAALREARADQIGFYEPRHRYTAELATTRAGAVVARTGQALRRRDLPVLRSSEPTRTFTRIVELYAAPRPVLAPGIHATAVIDPSARLAPDAAVGALAVIGAGAQIGPGAAIHPHAFVGPMAQIGAGTVLYPGAVVYDGVVIGARCIVHGSAVVGADGYGFDPTPAGWVKIPQLGTVVVEDDVEIGAACTIDRGRFGPTRIRRGAKLDDQVHVGHNVEVGEHAMLAAQVGIAGSALIGSRVMMGGQVGISGHLSVGEGARLAGKTGPFGDVPAGAEFLGYPGLPRREALRQQALLGRLPKLVERLGELEARVLELEARAAAGGVDA